MEESGIPSSEKPGRPILPKGLTTHEDKKGQPVCDEILGTRYQMTTTAALSKKGKRETRKLPLKKEAHR